MRTLTRKMAAALTLAGAIAMSAPASAGPMPNSLASVGAAAPQQITDVRWRGRGGGVAAGIAAGIITGAIIAGAANQYYYGPGPYYYGPGPYYYDGPAYYYGYDYGPPVYYAPRYYRYREPVYVAPPPGYRRGGRCWISTDKDRGFGYWGPC